MAALGLALLLLALVFVTQSSLAQSAAAVANAPAALAAAPDAGGRQPTAAAAVSANTLYLNRRPIVSFHATLLGRSPVERAEQGLAALQNALHKSGRGDVTVWLDADTAGLRVDGQIVFYLLPGDGDASPATPPLAVAAAADAVRNRLQQAVREVREMTDPRRIAIALAYAVGATAVAYLLMRAAFALRRQAVAQLGARLAGWERKHHSATLVKTYAQHARSAARSVASAVTWALLLLLLELWATFVLRQFAYTRPWAERSNQWLLGLLEQFALAAASAVPGLLTAGLIVFCAWLVSRAGTAFLQRAERGELVLGWLDADTAGPTRRVGNVVIWLFALAMAYPFLPGASSEAFKGVSVLAGLMLSLGASGVVGQVVAGLSLMYSRTLRPGEYVKIGDVDGTVTVVGLFATKIQTGLGEEVSLPNAVVFGQAVRNYSRLVQDGQFMLHTGVTIGYATPWRQVHALLLEAARRTPGVAHDPAPYVVQTALSDFYVEYRLCAQGNRAAPRRRAEAINQLHGNIQDVFNEHGVQIMSPHYLADPAQPQVVPPGAWYAPPATRTPATPGDPP